MNQPTASNATRPPAQLGHIIDEMLKRSPKEYREKLLASMSEAEYLLDRVRNELTTYYLALSTQDGLDAGGLDYLRGQVVASQSLFFAMAVNGKQFARGSHPLISAERKEEPGPLDM